MLYNIFIKKFQGDLPPYAVETLTNFYAFKYLKQGFVISFPGFMSTYKKSADDFLKGLHWSSNAYFTIGMNGSVDIKGVTPKISIQKYHNNSSFVSLSSLIKAKKDHSKILFLSI